MWDRVNSRASRVRARSSPMTRGVMRLADGLPAAGSVLRRGAAVGSSRIPDAKISAIRPLVWWSRSSKVSV